MTSDELNAIVSSEDFGIVVKMIVDEGLRRMEQRLNERINELDANAVRGEMSGHMNRLSAQLGAAIEGQNARITLTETRVKGDPAAAALADATRDLAAALLLIRRDG